MSAVTFFIDYILSFAVLIVVLVFVHELGHFLFARWCGVAVESFSIGFGKEIFGFYDKKGTRWKIAPIPLGGYVKMKGEMLPTGDTLSDDKDAFHNKSILQKALIVFAGPLFNLIFPIIIFLFIVVFFGIPTLKPIVKTTFKNTPAYKYLKEGDIITSINNKKITDFLDVNKIIINNPNKVVNIHVLRNNKDIDYKIKLSSQKENGKMVGFLGVKADQSAITYKHHNFLDSIRMSFRLYSNTLLNILNGFKQLITGKLHSDSIGGPIKIAQLSGHMLKDGMASWLFFLAALSINLAIVNLIPIPALDGGYLFLYLIQVITRRQIPPKMQNGLVIAGFSILMLLVVAVTFKDIFGLFK